jgi:hypothetical protein
VKVNHERILARLRNELKAEKISWVALRDEVIECEVKVRYLDTGSLDPLAAALLEELWRHRDAAPLSLAALAGSVAGKGATGLRVVGEVLTVLRRAGLVFGIQAEGNILFRASDIWEHDAMQVRERLVSLRLQYLPGSELLRPRIPGKPEEELDGWEAPWWRMPSGEEIYTNKMLISNIQAACHDNFSYILDLRYLAQDDSRHEILQRSQLKLIDCKFLNASVIDIVRTGYWNVHQCFLYLANERGGDSWNAQVYSYPYNIPDRRYTAYLRLRTQVEEFRDAILDASQEI